MCLYRKDSLELDLIADFFDFFILLSCLIFYARKPAENDSSKL